MGYNVRVDNVDRKGMKMTETLASNKKVHVQAQVQVYDTVLARLVKRIGFDAAIRFARNAGISFEDTYYNVFEKLPPEGRFDQTEKNWLAE